MYEVLKTMGRDIQGSGIKGIFIVRCRSRTLRLQDLVDLTFDL
jgi:hypothetical protein